MEPLVAAELAALPEVSDIEIGEGVVAPDDEAQAVAPDAEARRRGDGEVHVAAVVDDALDGRVSAVVGGAGLAESLPGAAAA